MNILFLNGSPKGKHSVTIQTALYLQKRYPHHQYDILNVGQQIKMFEKDFAKAKSVLENADIIIFAYPVYTFIVPYQLHRFIELMKDNKLDISGKFAAQLSTSKHFYDVTAHKFIEDNCYDLGLRYIGGLSADMDDLQSPKGQYEADCFFEKIMFCIQNNIVTENPITAKNMPPTIYLPQLEKAEKKTDKDVVLITNVSQDDKNLKNMIVDFENSCTYQVRQINVREYPFSGGCLGCFHCAVSEKCIYKDGFDEFLRTQIQNADGMIIAFTIENHYTHSSFKCYDDRQFCNGHRTVTTGKATGYLISGSYSKEENLRMIVEARSNVGGMYFCGVAGDEFNTAKEIQNLAKTFDFALCNKLQQPSNFYGVGGTKIFRDLVYLMQGIMQADHKFYKSHDMYDFPQKRKSMVWGTKFLGIFMKLPSVQKEMQGKMTEYICAPYKKVIENTKPKAG